MSDFLGKALPLILQGVACFPCSLDKRPLTAHGFKDASSDPEQIEQWSLIYPQALVGVPTGEASGLFVVDVDGDIDLHLPMTQINHTRRGKHFLFKHQPGLPSTAGKLREKVDSRGDGGYIIHWPSEGLPVENEGIIADCPQWIVDFFTAADKERRIALSEDVVPTSWEELCSAVRSIDPDCNRDEWIRVGMAIHRVDPGERGFDLWDNWSLGARTKYKAAEMPSQWRSFKDTHPNPVTVASLFKLAYASGWTRPAPDLTGMFKPVEENTVSEVGTKLTSAGTSPTADPEMWPEVLRNRALEVAKEVGCDPVVPLMAGLATVSAAVDKRITLRLNDSWKVSPTVWLMTIGEPSDKKTPGSRPMFDVLRSLEHEDKNRYEAAMLGWVGKEARHAAQLKAYREWQQSPESEVPNTTGPNVETLPPEPKSLRLIVQDATSQKVVGMSVGRERGFMLYLDEMNRWLQKLSDPRNPDDRGCWIQAYETGPYTMDRVGAGTIHTDNLAMSIYGNCQPAVFRNTVMGASQDGIIQRFLTVQLNPEKNAMWEDAVPSFVSFKPAWESAVRTIFAINPTEYELSPEGKEAFRRHCQWALDIRALERTVQSSDTYQTALGKLEGQTARIILLFHLLTDPYSIRIPEPTITSSIRIMEQFFYPSLRHVFLDTGAQGDKLVRALFDGILQLSGAKDVVSLSEARRLCRVYLEREGRYDSRADGAIRLAMDELSDLGYVAMYQDHPRSPVWTVNPNLAEQFKDERRNIINAKQKIIDTIRKATGGKLPDAIGWR